MPSDKKIDPIPKNFDSYEEAAEFWDTHDTTDYLDSFQTVDVQADLRKRHVEVELDDDVAEVLQERAQETGIPLSRLVSDMLRQQLISTS